MPAPPSGPHLQNVARQWHALAERRLAYFLALYRSGRWQHYYTRERFAALMLDVIKAARVWSELAGQAQGQTQTHRPQTAREPLRPAA